MAARKEKEATEAGLEQGLKVKGAWERITRSNFTNYRDRVNFEPIALALGTRTDRQCLKKWYLKLSPSVFSLGEWALGDDITLVRALQAGGYEWPWEVEWDRLVPNRTAEQYVPSCAGQAKRRWRSMMKGLPDSLEKSFDVCVGELAEKYSSHRCRQVLKNLKW
eukprot:gene30031-17926_t